MLYAAGVFLVIAAVSALLGFDGVAGAAAAIAQILFVGGLILFLVLLLMGRRPPGT